MFDFGDVTDAEELKKQKYKLEQNLKGTSGGNSGKSLIVPTIGDVEPPKYVQYPMEKEGSFLDLQKMVENNIIKACSWFRSLAGLESAGSLGNNQQLRNEWELAERLIRNEQDAIMSAVMKAFEGTTYVGEVDFNNQSPMNVVNDIASITTLLQNKNSIGVEAVNELLLMMGLDDAQATIISQAKNVSNDSE
tara:strand:- start:10 stop:585 length:576 start_codon:yes stop_codon:yes gene_type:complete